MKATKSVQREFVLAIIAGDVDVVKGLHGRGASVSQPDQYGWLPIHRAATNNRDEIIKLLVEWNSPLEFKGTDGWTALHLAAVSGSSLAVSALIRAGANVNCKSNKADTPLHLATISNVPEIFRALIRSGADTDALNAQEETPRDKARAKQSGELEIVLKEFGKQ